MKFSKFYFIKASTPSNIEINISHIGALPSVIVSLKHLFTKFCRLRLSDLVEKRFIIVLLPSQLTWPLTFHQYIFQGNSHDPRLGVGSLPTRMSLKLRCVNSCTTKSRSDLTCNRNIPYVNSGDLAIPGLSHLLTYSSLTFLNNRISRKKHIVSYMLGIYKILILEEVCFFSNF